MRERESFDLILDWAVIHRRSLYKIFFFSHVAYTRIGKRKNPNKKSLMKSCDLWEIVSVSIEISNHRQEKKKFFKEKKSLIFGVARLNHLILISVLSSEEEGKFNGI